VAVQDLNVTTPELNFLDKISTPKHSSGNPDSPLTEDQGNSTSEISFKEILGGLHFRRFFTKKGLSPYDQISYAKKTSVIREPDGTVVFEMKDVEVPEQFSQLATDILVSKYFRKAGIPGTGSETSIRQPVFRICHTLRMEGEKRGYFKDAEAAQIFEDELAYLLLTQSGAFNSPVWFNLGLKQIYGIDGSGGNWLADEKSGALTETTDAYTHPQLSACFIQSIDDDLMSIFELAKNEAKLFKYGSGTGTNFSNVRSKHEKLSGGGTSSGLMSFLEVLDRGAGATKSGGTTRRAAKMVVLDMDHPEIVDFISWKVKEEEKAHALMKAGYSSGFEGEAYQTVAGQNSNNSVRISDDFMRAVEQDKEWHTRLRTSGEIFETHKARDLFDKVCEAAWKVADPGVQFDNTCNTWHTCPESGRINGSNPCSEFMFLDDSACNLASLNLKKFLKPDGSFQVEAFRSAIRTFIVAQEIVVSFAAYPTQRIAQSSVRFRPLGLGYANLGTLLMTLGIPYDSEKSFAVAGAITSLMTGEAYKVSAELAEQIGAFAGYKENRSAMLQVIAKHQEHTLQIDRNLAPRPILDAALDSWNQALELGRKYGFRNAQTTLLAPTGTIGLLMDCDTTGVEPDYALVKFKKLAGGGYFKIINHSIPQALATLGYSQPQIDSIGHYATGHGTLEGAPYFDKNSANSKGLSIRALFSEQEIREANAAIAQYMSLDTYTPHIHPASLRAKGFTSEEIAAIQIYVNGSQTLEGAPHLKPEHYPVFDCANKCGIGQRYIQPMGHIKMMAAVQPFLSGAISKTVNLPNHATVGDIREIYVEAWKRGVKAVAIYRDGSKHGQPLGTQPSSAEESSAETEQKSPAAEVVTVPSVRRGVRKSLPIKRKGFTLESSVSGHKVFLRTGEYDDGNLGEIFIDMYKEGASYRSILNCFAISISIGLQYGVPLEKFVNSFTFTRFEPHGMTDHPYIKSSTSILDFIFRVLGYEYLNRTDFLQVKPSTADELDSEDHPVQSSSANSLFDTIPLGDIDTYCETTKEEEKKRASHPSAPQSIKGKAVQREKSEGRHHDQLDQHMAELMGDAPQCNICGHLTVRNGTCYKCLNCGNSLGCS